MINLQVFEQFPTIENELLLFRAFTVADAVEIKSIRSNKKVMRFMDSEYHTTIEASIAFIKKNIDSFKNQKGIFWAIIEKQTNTFIGDFSYWKLDYGNHRGEIGYSLKPEFWGKGYMQNTMKTLLDFGFNTLNLHSIEANINPLNSSSRKLLLKMGFVKEAYFKENYFYNGGYLDSEIYSLLKSQQID